MVGGISICASLVSSSLCSFFFFKQKTAYDMRISDWSSDVCSSDLRTDRGWIAYLNDLHKGRHTGAAWSWFLDLFAVACLVFSLTGLVLLQMHAGQRADRKSTRLNSSH